MNNRNNETQELKKTKNWVAILALMIIAMFFGVLYWFMLEPENQNASAMLKDICLVMFSTLVSIVIVTIAYTIYTEIQFKKSIRQVILDSLIADDDILKQYHKQSIIGIVKNSLDVILGKSLSSKFVANVLERQLDMISYRTHYKYNVLIKNGDTPQFHKIRQSIEYRKHLKVIDKRNMEMSCYFTFKEDPFREAPPKNIVFFREELTCKEFIVSLLDLRNDPIAIINKLNFKLYLFDNQKFKEIPSTDITVEVYMNKMIVLTTKIPEELITSSEKDGFISFFSKIVCEYPTNKNDYFYATFPEPTQDAFFSINFDENIIKKDEVHNVSFVMSPNYEIKKSENSNGLIFEPKNNIDKQEYNTIFPHAGIVFHW